MNRLINYKTSLKAKLPISLNSDHTNSWFIRVEKFYQDFLEVTMKWLPAEDIIHTTLLC